MRNLSRIISEAHGDHITPRSVQDAIPIRRIYDDGIILTGSWFTKTVGFTDINYSSASDGDKERMFISQAQLINSFSDLSYTKITIFNRPVSDEERLTGSLPPVRNENLADIRDEMQRYISSNVTSGGIVQDKYITFGINEKDIETARTYMTKQTAVIRTGLDAADSSLREIGIVYQSGMFNDLIRRDVSNALRDAHVNRDLFASVFRQMEIRWK